MMSLELPRFSKKGQDIRLFIIEDYPVIRTGLVASLEAFPNLHFVGEADSGEEGLVKLAHAEADILILDLGLPGMSGIDVCQQARERYADLKIIILTSHSDTEEVIAALGAGANAYVLKDIKTDRLKSVIEDVYDGASWLDPTIANVALSVFNSESYLNKRSGTTGTDEETPQLSDRELMVLKLLVQGKKNSEIAEELFVSVHTVKAHLGNIFTKLSVSDRVQAAIKALKHEIVEL